MSLNQLSDKTQKLCHGNPSIDIAIIAILVLDSLYSAYYLQEQTAVLLIILCNIIFTWNKCIPLFSSLIRFHLEVSLNLKLY